MYLTAVVLLSIQRNKPPFWDDIQQFKVVDRQHPVAKGQVLFLGSSSFTRWTDVASYFPGVTIVNRAFGGSTLLDVTRYFDDVVVPYRARQIVVYCGENDLANDSNLPAFEAANRFKTLFFKIRRSQPRVPVVYVGMKPSPSRHRLRAKYKVANDEIASFLGSQPSTTFVDVSPRMVDEHGKPRPEIFCPDMLHMNADGYRIWADLLKLVLIPDKH